MKNILIYYTGYVRKKSVKPLYVIISKTKPYIKEINRNKFLTLVLIDENEDNLKKFRELWRKIKYHVRWTNSNSYDPKYMKTRFYPDDDLPLKRALDLHDVMV